MGAGTLQKRVVFGAKVEDEEGAAETIGTAQLIPVLAGSAFPSTEQDSVERDVLRGTLSMQEDQAGLKAGGFSPICELAGPSSWAAGSGTYPAWDVLMRGAGLRRRRTSTFNRTFRIAIGTTWTTTTGGTVLRSGETITWATAAGGGSGTTAKILGDVYEGDTAIFFEHVSGTPIAGDDELEATTSAGLVEIPISGAGNSQVDALTYQPCSQQVSKVTVGTITSGPYNVGDEIVGATSGARGYVHEALSAAGDLYYEPFEDSGNFQSGESIAVSGGASATSSSVGTQVDLPSLTMSSFDAQENKAKGARGGVSMSFENGGIGKLQFSYDGALLKPLDTPVPAWPSTDPDAKPPKVVGSTIYFRKRDGTGQKYLPKFKSMTLAVENELTRVDYPGDQTEAGILSTKSGTHRVSGSIDPRAFKEALFGMLGAAYDKVPAQLVMQIGTGGSGNAFHIEAPMVLFQSPTKDADGALVRSNVPFACRAPSRDDELFLHVW